MAGSKIIKGILSDLTALPRKALKPYMKNGKLNANRVAIDLIPFLILFYFVNKFLQAATASTKTDTLDKCVEGFTKIFQQPPYFAPSFKLVPLLGGVAAGILFNLYMKSRKKNAKQFRKGEEYGSARWSA